MSTQSTSKRNNMQVMTSKKEFCYMCMEEHDIPTVSLTESTVFKDVDVTFSAIYQYCTNTDELYETEGLILTNHDALRKAHETQKGKKAE